MKAKIKALRESRKMTQKDLAEMLGVAVQSVSKWELGITVPRLPMLKKIAAIFSVDMNYFSDSVNPSEAFRHNRELMAIAEDIFNNPQMYRLFELSRQLSSAAVDEVIQFVDFQRSKEAGKKHLRKHRKSPLAEKFYGA